MLKKLYAIYDKKALFFSPPHCLHNKADALRFFDELLHDSQTRLCKYPADYQIYELGEWDERTGIITALKQPLFLEEGAAFIKKG